MAWLDTVEAQKKKKQSSPPEEEKELENTTRNVSCQVLDGMGAPVDLEKLPKDGSVSYDRIRDAFHCNDFLSCEAWTIAHCKEVYCKEEESCIDTAFADNEVVKCQGTRSCIRAHFAEPSHDVYCGQGAALLAQHSCVEATIYTDTLLSCFGSQSCSIPVEPESDGLALPRHELVVHVGETGYIRCIQSRSTDGPACQSMLIHVPSKERACVADKFLKGNTCAVVCISPQACDQESLRFFHEGQEVEH